MPESWSWDAEVGAGSDPTAGGAVAFQLPSDLQSRGVLWPNPAQMVSDHSAEGAPWRAETSDEVQHGWEFGPPGGGAPRQPEFVADHSGPSVPYDAAAGASYYGQTLGPQPGTNHQGGDGLPFDPGNWGTKGNTQPNAWPQLNIGKPFTQDQGSGEHRTLATDTWDATGKRINPADAPSAPHELYGSQHYTRPRMTPYELPALFDWAWPEGERGFANPGYWGVWAGEPDNSPRPQGAVVAQMPSDPYVAAAVPGPVSPSVPSYDDWAF